MTSNERKQDTDDVAGHARAAAEALEASDPEEDEATEESPREDFPLSPAPPPPAAIAELAAACVRFVTTRYGVMLDFAQETLSLVDQYVADARKEIATLRAEGDVASADGTLELVAAGAGAYLGEVIRHELGGMWFAEGERDGWRLDLEQVYLSFNPIGMMREALLLDDAEGWHAHLEMDPAEKDEVLRRLDGLPEVEDVEFYAPTTRFDVVSIAIEALRAQMVEAGHADVRFGRDDYKR